MHSAWRRRVVVLLASALGVACASAGGGGKAASRPATQWQTTIPGPKAAVVAAALRVLADSGFQAEVAGDSSEIVTDERVPHSPADSSTLRGVARFVTGSAVGFRLLLKPARADSIRLAISGQRRLPSAKRGIRARTHEAINALDDDWALVESLGAAIRSGR